MDVKGKWTGYYQYGVGYNLPFFAERVKIDVTLVTDSLGNIQGTMTERHDSYAVPLESSIKGFIDFELISFIKSYDASPEIKEDYSGIEIGKGSLNVDYSGLVDQKNGALYGEWVIEEKFVNNDGQNDIEFFTGIWMLKRP
ncbi:hypothetical protein RQM59_10935 [Flavobacteriaceae bacterium S356]|uniref:Uncharacterized protein n=1 Tax=Asprobacillus argus TaxID=3076534 RepID=A0ABU3LGR2_9FLAO|nr:hypothetical protein [Flavobacteriaceae bacterium S356]